ncbi:reticulon-2b [Engraulis encrasicolus]|uniref:reticulon-2b n=1 Tax=Engraulis encrasicolus TaxID=184585 RepID=UPI002FD4BFC9
MASKVIDLIYWRSVGKTGTVFTGLVVGLACLFQMSLITVVSNSLLTLMALTVPIWFLYQTMTLVRLNDGSHPFQTLLDEDMTLTDETTIRVVENIVLLIANAVTEMKRLIFIGSLFDSIKFLVLLYLLTYVGEQTNGLTLVMSAVICAFSIPLFYKLLQGRIDKTVSFVQSYLDRGKLVLDSLYELFFPPPESEPEPEPPATTVALKAKKAK